MHELDRHDVAFTFQCLDRACRGGITVQQLQTLYLGLGFAEPTRMTCTQLATELHAIEHVDLEHIPLVAVWQVLEKHPRNRQDNMRTAFSHIDQGNKGYWDENDVTALANAVHATPALTAHQPHRMLAFCSSDGRVDFDDFCRLMGPVTPSLPVPPGDETPAKR